MSLRIIALNQERTEPPYMLRMTLDCEGGGMFCVTSKSFDGEHYADLRAAAAKAGWKFGKKLLCAGCIT